jgi:hypothetical protein
MLHPPLRGRHFKLFNTEEKENKMDFFKRACGIAGRAYLMGLLFLAAESGVFAQAGSRLGQIAILPFSGGTADEREGIAELFSFTSGMMANFRVMPRTGITRAVANEQEFQSMSGMTSADTIARLGNQFGAEYVMAGSITSVGTQHLLIVSIIRIDVIRQVAGDFLLYDSLDALNQDSTILERMAENLVKMLRAQRDDLDKLALLPVDFPDSSANVQEGDALAQILAIYLLRYNAYAVYPRTKTLEQVESEYETQLSGSTRDSEQVTVGQADNPPYALAVISRRIGSGSRFNASIIDLEGGNQIAGQSEQYATLLDGMTAIEFLARELSGLEVSDRERNRRTSSVTSAASAVEAQARREEAARRSAEKWDKFLSNSGIAISGFFGMGVSGTGLVEGTDDDITTPDIDEKVAGEMGFSGDLLVELRLSKYFGIQTGVRFSTSFLEYEQKEQDPIEYDTLTVIQLPIMARINLGRDMGGMELYLALFGGVGLNLSTTAKDAESIDLAPASFIGGVELGVVYYGRFRLGAGVLYDGDMSDGKATYAGTDVAYRRSQLGLNLSLGYYIPFRKSNRW